MKYRIALLLLHALAAPAAAQELDLPSFGPQALPAEKDRLRAPDPPPIEEPPPPSIYGEDVPTESESLVYVLDCSGSMRYGNSAYTDHEGNPQSGSRLDRAKAELARSILALTEGYTFDVVRYTCGVEQLGERQATKRGKDEALAWIFGSRAGGATGTGPATALALQDRENLLVVVLSDGSPNCGAQGREGHRAMIRQANTQGAVIHTFAIGDSGYALDFMRAVAEDAGGRCVFVP